MALKQLTLIALAILMLSPAIIHAQAAEPAALLEASDAAYNAHDLEAVSALFADDAVRQLIPPPSPEVSGIWRGKEEIRAQWQREFALNARVERIGEYQSSGDTVTGRARYWDDSLLELGVAPIEYTIEVTVREGKITSSTITTSPQSVAKIVEAISRMPAAGATAGPEAAGNIPRTLPSTGSPERLPVLWLLLLAGTGVFFGASLRIFASLSARRRSHNDRLQG